MILSDLIERVLTEPAGTATAYEIGDEDGIDNPHEALTQIARAVAGTPIYVSIAANDTSVDVTWRPKTPEELEADS